MQLVFYDDDEDDLQELLIIKISIPCVFNLT